MMWAVFQRDRDVHVCNERCSHPAAADKKRDDKRAGESGKEALTFENLMNSPWKVCPANEPPGGC